MEPLQNNQTPTSPPVISEATNESVVTEEKNVVNIYPMIRHAFLIICILLIIAIILFLFYQNGKSIYDNGL